MDKSLIFLTKGLSFVILYFIVSSNLFSLKITVTKSIFFKLLLKPSRFHCVFNVFLNHFMLPESDLLEMSTTEFDCIVCLEFYVLMYRK